MVVSGLNKDYWQNKQILLTGGAGFLGSFIQDKLIIEKRVNSKKIHIPRSKQLDLRKWKDCSEEIEDSHVCVRLWRVCTILGHH